MKKQLLYIAALLLWVSSTFAQSMSDAEVNDILAKDKYFPKIRDLNKFDAVDQLQLRVTYDFSYVVDTCGMRRYNEPMVLDIGENINRYYSYNAYLRDSMQMVENSKGPTAKGGGYGYLNITNSVIPKEQTATYMDIFTNHTTNQRDVTLRVETKEFLYSEEVEPIEWSFSMVEQQEILGYSCMVAECVFGGRKWKVWFTVDIPYPYGMWKLGGVPGIILKAEDSQNLFSWQAVGLEQGRGRKIYRYNDDVKLSKRKDVDKLWQTMWCASHTVRYLFQGEKTLNVMLPDGTRRKVDINMSLAKIYYPQLEIE